MKRLIILLGCVAGLVGSEVVFAGCQVHTSNRTYGDGEYISYDICDGNGAKKTSGSTGVTTSTAILAGQLAVTATAQALPSNSVQSVCVKALAANSIKVYVGPSGVTTSNGMELSAGDGWCTSVSNSNAIYVIASTTGASISWAGRN